MMAEDKKVMVVMMMMFYVHSILVLRCVWWKTIQAVDALLWFGRTLLYYDWTFSPFYNFIFRGKMKIFNLSSRSFHFFIFFSRLHTFYCVFFVAVNDALYILFCVRACFWKVKSFILFRKIILFFVFFCMFLLR